MESISCDCKHFTMRKSWLKFKSMDVRFLCRIFVNLPLLVWNVNYKMVRIKQALPQLTSGVKVKKVRSIHTKF